MTKDVPSYECPVLDRSGELNAQGSGPGAVQPKVAHPPSHLKWPTSDYCQLSDDPFKFNAARLLGSRKYDNLINLMLQQPRRWLSRSGRPAA